jgi:Prealbumin-like fold domain
VLVLQAGDVPEPGLDVGGVDVLVLGPGSVPVAGAWLQLADSADEPVADAVTDANGRASFDFLDEGSYALRWERAATAPAEVMVHAGMRGSVIVRALGLEMDGQAMR